MNISERMNGKPEDDPEDTEAVARQTQKLGEHALYESGSIAKRLDGPVPKEEEASQEGEVATSSFSERTARITESTGEGGYQRGSLSTVLEGGASAETAAQGPLELNGVSSLEAGGTIARHLNSEFNKISSQTEETMMKLREEFDRVEAAAWQDNSAAKEMLDAIGVSLSEQENQLTAASQTIESYLSSQEAVDTVGFVLDRLRQDLEEMGAKTKEAREAIAPLIDALKEIRASETKDPHNVESCRYDFEQALRERAITGADARERIKQLSALGERPRQDWKF